MNYGSISATLQINNCNSKCKNIFYNDFFELAFQEENSFEMSELKLHFKQR